MFYTTIVSKLLFLFFGVFAKGKRKRVPLLGNSSFSAKLLRAFYDDEGSISVSSNLTTVTSWSQGPLGFFPNQTLPSAKLLLLLI